VSLSGTLSPLPFATLIGCGQTNAARPENPSRNNECQQIVTRNQNF